MGFSEIFEDICEVSDGSRVTAVSEDTLDAGVDISVWIISELGVGRGLLMSLISEEDTVVDRLFAPVSFSPSNTTQVRGLFVIKLSRE